MACSAVRWFFGRTKGLGLLCHESDCSARLRTLLTPRLRSWCVLSAAGLASQGGASDVGESIVQYTHSVRADVAVLGCRGLGAMKRTLMNLIGMGSVSDYCLRHAKCPVLIMKH